MSIPLSEIEAARARIASGISRTPCEKSVPLSEITGCQIYCKLENLQRTGSFKERGARNALMLLDEPSRQRGVIAASAGNHALALAWHGKLLNIPVTVVMPEVAPMTKIRNCRNFGARVLLHGRNIQEARSRADEIIASEGAVYINGYDDLAVIQGQGTLGLEILEQVPDVDAIIVPVGGAGLVAGVASAVKQLRPQVQIISVESEAVPSFAHALDENEPVAVEPLPTFADGLAVPKVGARAFKIAAPLINKHVVVSERSVALAIVRILELEKTVVEGAGAASLAPFLQNALPELKGKKVVLPFCGGNIDLNLLGRIIERGLAADGRLCQFRAVISDRPGGLARLADILAEEEANIVQVQHERVFATNEASKVTVECTIETRDQTHADLILSRLSDEGLAWKMVEPPQ